MTIPVAHDFTCPWCWIALFQVQELKREFPGLAFEWLGYELYPEEIPWPEPSAPLPAVESNRPKTPSRIELAYAAQGMEKPTAIRPKRMRIHNAHVAVEFAKTLGDPEPLIEKLYRAYWEDGRAIGEIDTLRELAEGLIPDIDEMVSAIQDRRFADNMVGFDEPAYAKGVYYVPTYWIGGERYAEQPIQVLRAALQQVI
jgi:predicted DsbA family dithiol-disulfide isomerase